MIDRQALKKQLHLARVNLDYRKKHSKSATAVEIAASQAEVDRLAELYSDSDPAKFTLNRRSDYFIGPLKGRGRGKRGDGPTIKCFRCEVEKPKEDFYERGCLCRECVRTSSGEWAEENPERSKEIKNAWAEENREEINEKTRKRYHDNLEASRERSRAYSRNNKGKRNASQNAYLKKKLKNDPQYRAYCTCRRRMWNLIDAAGSSKDTPSAQLIGLPRLEFIAYLESLFLPGMSWENYGKGKDKWNIEHIIPAAYFNHLHISEQKRCWNYTNLRPMWEPENSSKSDKMPDGRRGRDLRLTKIIVD
jgi:hypothetical protein